MRKRKIVDDINVPARKFRRIHVNDETENLAILNNFDKEPISDSFLEEDEDDGIEEDEF